MDYISPTMRIFLALTLVALGLCTPPASPARAAGNAGIWIPTGSMAAARGLHTTTLLPNGQVLVAGGSDNTNSLASAELYDPAAGTWTATGSLGLGRIYPTATLLPTGQVLVAGGAITGRYGYIVGMLTSAELYTPMPWISFLPIVSR